MNALKRAERTGEAKKRGETPKRTAILLAFFAIFTTFTTFFLIFSTAQAAASQQPITLPTLDEWQCGELRTSDLQTVSGNYGSWQARTYRAPGGIAIQATLMTGKGPRALTRPPVDARSVDGALGSGATYKTWKDGERLAILEHHPILGYALSIEADDFILTLESKSGAATEELLARTAHQLADALAAQRAQK